MGMLDGKVAVVTGAGHGIGRGHAMELAKHGTRVVVNDVGGSAHGEGTGTAAEDTVKLIADLYEMPPEIGALEYDNTIMKLETSGDMSAPNVHDAVQLSLDLAKLGGFKDIVPTDDVISTKFKPVPTKP